MASTITSPGTSHQTPNRLLLAAVFGPYGVKDEYAEALGMQMELLNNQITREQGVHSPRQSYWSFGLYLLAANIRVPTTVLDFPFLGGFYPRAEKRLHPCGHYLYCSQCLQGKADDRAYPGNIIRISKLFLADMAL